MLAVEVADAEAERFADAQAAGEQQFEQAAVLSFGSRSQGGERTIERLLSIDQTCRLQRRSLYGYLSDALTAKTRGDPVPTLS